MKNIILGILFAASLIHAQVSATSPTNTFTASRQHSPSGSAVVVTLQQPAASSHIVEPLWAKVYSTVAISVEIERDGTAATATAETEVNTSSAGTVLTGAATVFYDSDAGNGTTVDTYDLAAKETIWINLKDYNLKLIGDGTTNNITLRSDSVTGTVRLTISWREW